MPPIVSKPAPTVKPKPIPHPHLTNRGSAGLLGHIPAQLKETLVKQLPHPIIKGKTPDAKHRIAPALQSMAVPIDSLIPDPENARLHPERNMEAIKESLRLYGQVKPVVVRTQTNVVVAGNGTLAGAKALGWTELAATFVDMTDVEAAGFGLADNRTAELAKWDLEVVSRLDKLLSDAEHDSVGWSDDELLVLRTDWTKFPSSGTIDEKENPDDVEEPAEIREGDSELLMRLKVTIDEPITKVEHGQVWYLGKHTLIVMCVVREAKLWGHWLNALPSVDILFAPYPGPLMVLTLAASESILIMVQPDKYIAGHIIDQYIAVNGDSEVILVD